MTAEILEEQQQQATLQPTYLKGKFTSPAKQRVQEFLAGIRSFEPTLGLLYGDIEGAVAGRPSWSLTAFDPQTVDEMITMYASFGVSVSYELDGFTVVIPQLAHIAELDTGTFDFKGNRLVQLSVGAA